MSHGRQTVGFSFTPYFPRSGDRGYSRLEQDDMLKYVPFGSGTFCAKHPSGRSGKRFRSRSRPEAVLGCS